MIQLRDYQVESIDGVDAGWKVHRSLIGQMATGGGKSVIFTEIIRRNLPGRALVLAHLDVLVTQIFNHLAGVGIDAEIEKAEQVAGNSLWNRSPCVIATPQTLYASDGRRLKRWKPTDFNLLIVDELHHWVSKKYMEIIMYFQNGNPDLKMLGVTATPERSDNVSLKKICQGIGFEVPITRLLKDGWLVPVRSATATLQDYDLSQCKLVAGELHQGQVAEVLERDKILMCMADEIMRRTAGKRTLIFCQTVIQGRCLTRYLNNHKEGIADCVFSESETKKEIRKDVFARFGDGRLEKMVNVGVATESYDNPNIEWIVICRPCMSKTLFAQMIGRGTRALKGILDDEALNTPSLRRARIAASAKPWVTCLDFKGNFGKHDLASVIDVLGGSMSEEAKKIAKRKLEDEGGDVMRKSVV